MMANSAARAAPKLDVFIASPNTAPFVRSAGVNGGYLQDKLALFATAGVLGALAGINGACAGGRSCTKSTKIGNQWQHCSNAAERIMWLHCVRALSRIEHARDPHTDGAATEWRQKCSGLFLRPDS